MAPNSRYPHPSRPCREWANSGTCRYGLRCKFLHAKNGQSNGRPSPRPSSYAPDPHRDKFMAWKRLRPQPNIPYDGNTEQFFRTAADLVDNDAALAQQLIKELATDDKLLIIRAMIQDLALQKPPLQQANLWMLRVLPFFRTILHQSIVESVILEQEVATIYRSLLGIDATRLKHLFDFVLHIIDHWTELPFVDTSTSGLEALSLSCSVLAKVIDTSSSNVVNAHFESIAQDLRLRSDAFGSGTEDFHSLQATRYLEYVCRRLGLGQSIPNASHLNSQATGAAAAFTLSQDLPGALSRQGRRHDNDHADIGNIRLMPTYDEILSRRDEYLPTMDPSQHHVQGLRGLLDRHFRLVREDTLHDLRNAIRSRLQSNAREAEVRTRVISYDNATAVDVAFERQTGLEFVIRIDQPQGARNLDKSQRAAWWATVKRLADGALVCIVDESGTVLFLQVSRSTKRTTLSPEEAAQMDVTGENNKPRYSLCDDGHHAYVYLRMVDSETAEVQKALLWLKNMEARQRRQLFEFPSILLPSFAPPLRALQSMSRKLDMPFMDIIALAAGDEQPTIAAPLYTRRPGFSYNLGCLTNDGTELTYTPGDHFDPATLCQHTTLDLTQSRAIIDSLSRSLALIQGPPGTGKSYTGEAIIKVLLASKSRAKLGPIVCVCYTNHALDQLLEHLVDGGIKNIIRIGSRSKSERLQPVNLREVVKQMTRTKAEGKALWDSIEVLNSETENVQRNLNTYKHLNTNEKIREFLSIHHRAHHDEIFGSAAEEAAATDDGGGAWETVRYGRKKAMQTWLRGGVTRNGPSRPLDELQRSELKNMTHHERVLLYQSWLVQAMLPVLEPLTAAHDSYEDSRERNQRVRSAIDLRCLQEANIIGVTTTGLATNLDLLRRVNGKVLVCEEAGEVLEAHLLTALLPTIEHAILIGDHFQLRPQIQDWRLQRANPAGLKYSLDVSLFERLVRPSIAGTPSLPFSILDTQRRMHPSISELVRSTLYPTLADSAAVVEYPRVCGITKRLFWLHHESPESGRNASQDTIETSYSNDFELDMVSALVSHLLRQGVYKPGEIAVLTPYLGQLKKLRQKLGSSMQIMVNDRDSEDLANLEAGDILPRSKKGPIKASALDGVRAATVDNFQGEEATVIIVSLVRSNNEKKCGFLSTSNRINVLLSRARHGMYIIGNSHTSSHVPMWAQVIGILRREGHIGNELELQCPRHPGTRSLVSQPDHFVQFSPDGGCALRCDRRLDCGHSCTGPCHSAFLHDTFKCLEDCPRPKENCEHPCRKRCGEPCGTRCTEVIRDAALRLPCEHVIDTVECWRTLDPAAIKCTVVVEKLVPGCQHKVKLPCHTDVGADSYLCKSECGFQQPCGHVCKAQCSSCFRREGGRLVTDHLTTCRQVCGRDYNACNHRCEAVCHQGTDCLPCPSPCQNQCVHSKCGKKCHEPCAPCAQETCPSSCPHSKCNMPCAAPCDWVPCTKRCTKLLSCDHQCPSVCGEACPEQRFCQQCASEETKDQVVDLLMFETYRSINLDENPCIFPDCGHFLTYATMDGQMGLGSFYQISEEGLPTAVIGDSHPFDLGGSIKACPTCRGSLRNISRYGRIVRRGLLDESTKKFIAWANGMSKQLSESFLSARDELDKKPKADFVFPTAASEGYSLEGPRQEQMSHLLRLTGSTRHKRLKSVRNQILKYLDQVRKDEQPYQRVSNLVSFINRQRHGGMSNFAFDQAAIQMGSFIEASALGLRCDILLISDYIELCRRSADGSARAVRVQAAPHIRDCEKLIQLARDRHYTRFEVEGHIFLAMFCAFALITEPPESQAAPDSEETAATSQRKEIKQIGLEHINTARAMMDHYPSTAVLETECDAASRMLHEGVFYSAMSPDEMRAVYQAMAREFSGTGHWYTCQNGHPFTIGECGRAMELTRCPECRAPVGGQNHQSAEGVRYARDIEALGTGVAGLGL